MAVRGQHLAVGAAALSSGFCDVSVISRADCLSVKCVKCGESKISILFKGMQITG